jgi:hypothetical protein
MTNVYALKLQLAAIPAEYERLQTVFALHKRGSNWAGMQIIADQMKSLGELAGRLTNQINGFEPAWFY